MQVRAIHVDEINIAANRQRRTFDPTLIQELAGSIAQNGLIHPVVIRKEEESGELFLVAGERRLKALEYVWEYGQEVHCGDYVFPERLVPCIYLGELDPIDAFEIELEENIQRADLSWSERATARSQLFELRRLQAERDGTPEPTIASIAAEVAQATSETLSGGLQNDVRTDIILAKNLNDPDIAKAKSRVEAFKILKRKEEATQNAKLSAALGPTFNSSVHSLRTGDTVDILPTLEAESFDVILTDPPYGMNAHEFGDSAAKAAGAHFYDDSADGLHALLESVIPQLWRIAKPECHVYFFCDIAWFFRLQADFTEAGFKVFRTPLIWHNPTAMRAPWPDQGPQRKWQSILYAVKGNKLTTKLYPDLITFASDDNLGHQAQKPVGLFADLLKRSVRPGDNVIDPFCGTGTIFAAAHQFQCRATGIELNPSAAGIAAKRIQELK